MPPLADLTQYEKMIGEYQSMGVYPRGRDGTVFVTIEDETGDTQLTLPPRTYTQHKTPLESQIIQATGTITRHDATTSTIITNIQPIHTNTQMPPTHNWH